MIRAAAKNHAHVSVCVDPEDYGQLLSHLGGSNDSPDARAFRQRLAWKAYQHCASYDTTVAEWLWQQIGTLKPQQLLQVVMCSGKACSCPCFAAEGGPSPQLTVSLRKKAGLRYGENPHQAAAFYEDESLDVAGRGGIASSKQHHGKEVC